MPPRPAFLMHPLCYMAHHDFGLSRNVTMTRNVRRRMKRRRRSCHHERVSVSEATCRHHAQLAHLHQPHEVVQQWLHRPKVAMGQHHCGDLLLRLHTDATPRAVSRAAPGYAGASAPGHSPATPAPLLHPTIRRCPVALAPPRCPQPACRGYRLET